MQVRRKLRLRDEREGPALWNSFFRECVRVCAHSVEFARWWRHPRGGGFGLDELSEKTVRRVALFRAVFDVVVAVVAAAAAAAECVIVAILMYWLGSVRQRAKERVNAIEGPRSSLLLDVSGK